MKKILFTLLLLFISIGIVKAYDGNTYRLVVLKIDPSSSRLPGAEFAICSDAACKNVISTSNNIYQWDEDSGYMNFDIDLNFNKVYYLKETKAPTGYRVRTKEDGSPFIWYFLVKKRSDGYITFEVDGCDGRNYLYSAGWQSDTHYSYNGSKDGIFFLEVRNEPTANLLVHKTDEEGNIVKGTKYKLTSNNSEEIVETDENGNAIFDMLRPKDYVLQEYEATPGYMLDTTKYTFYVENDHADYNLYRRDYISNRRYKEEKTSHYGKYEYYSAPSYVPLDGNVYYVLSHVERKAPNYEIKIIKTKDDDTPIKNKKYDISTDENCRTIIQTGTTNNDGELYFSNLVSSEQYYICEHRDKDEPLTKPIEVKLVHTINDTGTSSVKGTFLYINNEENSSKNDNFDATVVTVNVNENTVLVPTNNNYDPSNPEKPLENPPTNNQGLLLLTGIVVMVFGAFILLINKQKKVIKYEGR